jgi:HK97 family phage major capsid protein/HK97 family phage prohead protease
MSSTAAPSTAQATALKPGSRAERAFVVERASVNEAERRVTIAFASELPYQRYWGVEILDCTATSIRLGRVGGGAGPLLWNHDTDEQIGVIESVSIDADRVCRAVVRFGKSTEADEVFVDVAGGVIRNVSVGYLIHSATLVQKGDNPDGDQYRVTDWEPYEISFVSVPADPSVGVGRSAEDDPRIPSPIAALAASPVAAPAAADPPASTTPTPPEIRTMSTTTVEPVVAAPALNISADADAIRKAERQRATEIRQIGEQFAKFGGQAAATKALDDGTDVQAFRNLMANAITSAQTTQVTNLDLSKGDQKRFSVMRAIRALADRNWQTAGFERECSEAICKRAGIPEAVNGGFYVPMDIMQRDLTVGTPTAGGNMVATNLQPKNFIDLLRARAVVARLGATMLPGLVGNVAIPKLTGAATGYWLANEATAITESQQTIGQLALSPKTVGAYTEVSRLLMLQSTPSADQLVMNDFAKVIALAIDLAALEGTGASGQPTGISATAGIGSVTGTTIAYAGIVEFQTDVAAGNALAPNSAYLTTPAVAGLLAQRQRFASTDTPLWQGSILEGQMGGFLATTTTQMTAASMMFGDFSQVVIGEWGMFEIALNPYASFAAGITGIRAMQSVDIGIRQAAAFSRATTIT